MHAEQQYPGDPGDLSQPWFNKKGLGVGGLAGAAAGPLQVAEQRQREIPHEFDRLERTLKGCAQGIETLAARLSESVLRSEPPAPAQTGSNSPTAVPQTPLGSRLQELTSAAAMVNDRIHSLIARLEA